MTTDKVFAKHRPVNIPGHRDKVYTLGWNRQGDRLATGSWDSTIRTYQVDGTGGTKGAEELVTFAGSDKHYCEQLMWSTTQDTVLATLSSDKQLRTWDVRGRRGAGKAKLGGLGQTLSWHVQGRVLAVGMENNSIALFDIRSVGDISKPLRVIDKAGEVNDIAFTLDGNFLMQGSSGVILVYQYEPWQLNCKLHAHNGPVWAIAIDPTGRQIATGGGDGVTCVWDQESLICTHVLSSKDTPHMSVEFSHNGQYLAIGSNEDTSIEIRNACTGELAQTLALPRPTDNIKWNPKHLMLASTGDYGRDRDGREREAMTMLFAPTA